MDDYTCSQCSKTAPPFTNTLDGRKIVDIPKGWSTLTLSGTPEMHKLLCDSCVRAVHRFFSSWESTRQVLRHDQGGTRATL